MCFSICYLCQQFALECKEKSDILSTILELYFGIFNNYETVIEHRLEMKKKNVLMKEMERNAKEYKQKYDNAMKSLTSLQKKLTITNTKFKKSEIMYNSLKTNYNRVTNLYERMKMNTFNSIRKLTREQTEYWNMVQERRFNPTKTITYKYSFTKKSKHVTSVKNMSKIHKSNSSFSESIIADKDEADEEFRKILENVENDVNELVFIDRPLKLNHHKSNANYSCDNFYYEKLILSDIESNMCKTDFTGVAKTKVKNKNQNDVQVQTDNIELYKIKQNNYMYQFSQNTYLTPVEQRLMDKLK
jgi:hypothetical protein